MDDSISLRELVDADIVQAIQDSFAKTVGVSSVIFLPDGDALTRFSNPIKFCSLIQSTKEGRQRCFQSFAEMSKKAVGLSEPEIMYCFAHGAHFVAPIIIGGERKATMYAGQFRPEKFSPEQLKELKKIAAEIDLDPELLVKEANNMRTVGDERVLDCLHSFIRTVKGIAELGAQALELRQAKDALQKSHDELEMRVQERTAELTEINKELRREVAERKSAEDALRESEARTRALLNAPTDAMILIDSAGIILAVNNIHAKWLKKSMDELISTCIFDLFPSDLAEFRKAQINVVFNTGMPIHYEDSQNEKIYHVNVYPVFGAKGAVTAVAAYIQDITESKQAEDALREGREKLRSIVEQSSDGVVLADEEGTIIEWNRGHERITGLSRAEVLGKPVWDVMFRLATNEQDDPALYERIKAGVLNILKTGQSEWLDRLEEREVQRPDGVRRVIQVAVFPIKTCKGFMAGAISRDITERKRAEDALRKSEEKYRVLFETAKDAIFVSDETGKFVDVNQAACESLGYSREELLRLSNREIDADPTGYEAFLKVRDTPAKEAIFEVNQQRKDKTLLPVEITGKFFKVDGELLSLAIARDITEQKAAEEQIKRSLREKDVLIQEIHHRVKNNFQVVSSLLSMQARTTRNKEALDVLSKSQSRINTMAIIHTKLYKSGDLSELNMKEFVGTLSEQLFRSYLVNDTKITRIVHVTDRKFPVSVGVHVGLIINELLSNALEHAFSEKMGGKIEVSLAAPDSGRVNLRVSDDGAGLPPGFDINSTKTLGLHLVKMLVEDQLQGTMEVISDGGVTFNIEFDVRDDGGSSYGESKNTDR